MSFFKLYKPREYGYRYIYYDPKKEAKKVKAAEERIIIIVGMPLPLLGHGIIIRPRP